MNANIAQRQLSSALGHNTIDSAIIPAPVANGNCRAVVPTSDSPMRAVPSNKRSSEKARKSFSREAYKLKTLLVDHEGFQRTVHTDMLKSLGLNVVPCSTVAEAQERWNTTFFPLVLLSRLALDPDLAQHVQWIRQRPHGNEVYIIVMTSSNEPEALQQVLAAGADDYILKPIRMEELRIRFAVANKSLTARQKILKTSRKLRRVRQRYQNIFNDSIDALLTTDSGGVIRSFNPAAERLFDYRSDEIIGQNVSVLIPSPVRERHDTLIEEYLRNRTNKFVGLTREVMGSRRDGKIIPVEITVSEIRNRGKILFAAVVRDISERKWMQQELVRTISQLEESKQIIEEANRGLETRVQEKSAELAAVCQRLKVLDAGKRDFLRVIAHELRTPVSGLLGSAELLFRQPHGEMDRKEFESLFENSKRRLLRVIDQSLLFAQIDPTDQYSFNLCPQSVEYSLSVAEATVSQFAASRKVTLQSIPSTESMVMADSSLLAKAFEYLYETAIKFATSDSVHTHCETTDKHVHVNISTEGRTIPPALISRFFEVFAISDALTPGGDLGLSAPLARRILALFSGTVSVENSDPAGIVIRVALPKLILA